MLRVEKIGANRIRFTKTDGKELNISSSAHHTVFGLSASIVSASVWEALSYQAKATQITGTLAEGTLWFNASLNIEV